MMQKNKGIVARYNEPLKRIAFNLYPLIVVVIIWHLASIYVFHRSVLLPAPLAVARSFYHMLLDGSLAENFAYSFVRVISGFLVGSTCGLVLGLLMGRIKQVEQFFNPIVNLLQPIPKLAWIPLAILWFGLGFRASLFIISLATFWAVLFTTWHGAKGVNKVLIKVAESMGASKWYIYSRVIFPAALPNIITGMRLGIARAWRALVAAELLIAGTAGIGYMIFHAREFFRTEEIIVGMLVIGMVGVTIEKLIFRVIEKKTMQRWGLITN